MIPNVFISSTIQDLHHLRDSIRETVIDLGYSPVMSDYGDIGYLPTISVEESCYASLGDCQIAILIMGKRYGSKAQNNLSVTHNEFRTAKDKAIPIITIVEKEIMTFKRVYEENKSELNNQVFPGMEAPLETFSFLQEIMESPLNNGILSFDGVSEARNHLKMQLAHIFGDLLRRKFDPLKNQLIDIYSEIKTLRHELLAKKGNEPLRYLKATRYLLSEDRRTSDFRIFLETLQRSIDNAIPKMLESKTFDELLEKLEAKLEITEDRPNLMESFEKGELLTLHEGVVDDPHIPIEEREIYRWGISVGRQVIMNKVAKRRFNYIFEEFLKETIVI